MKTTPNIIPFGGYGGVNLSCVDAAGPAAPPDIAALHEAAEAVVEDAHIRDGAEAAACHATYFRRLATALDARATTLDGLHARAQWLSLLTMDASDVVAAGVAALVADLQHMIAARDGAAETT